MGWLLGWYAVASALFHLWTAYAGVLEPREMRALHLLFLIPPAFVLYPAGARSPRNRPSAVDVAWLLATIVPCVWVVLNATELTERWEGVHPMTRVQVVMGTLLVLAVLEASRRAVGFWFFVTTLLRP